MKALIRNIGLILFAIAVVFIASGCNLEGADSTVKTQLILNEDGSGERVMRVDILRSEFDTDFNGTFEDLVKLTEEKKPEFLEFSTVDTEDEFYLLFSMKFSSIEDYNSKMKVLVPDISDKAKLSLESGDGLWKSGVYIRESLNAEKPLEWLEDAIVEAGFASSAYRSYILDSEYTVVSYNGMEEELRGSNDYTIDTRTLFYVENIVVLTKINDLESIGRTHVFTIGVSEDNRKKSIEDYDLSSFAAYFADVSGPEALVTYDESSVTVSYHNLAADTLAKSESGLYDYGYFNVTKLDNVDDIFSEYYSISQSFDVAKYLRDDGKNNLTVSAGMEFPDGFEMLGYEGDSLTIKGTGENGTYFAEACVCREKFRLQYISVDFVNLSKDRVGVSIDMLLDTENISAEELKGLENNINTRMSSETSAYSDMDFSYSVYSLEKGGYPEFIIEFGGDVEEACEGLERFTGRAAYLEYEEEGAFWELKRKQSFSFNYDLTDYQPYFSGKPEDVCTVVDMGNGKKITDVASSCEYEIDENVIRYAAALDCNDSTVKSKGTNPTAIILYGSVLGIILILIICITVLAIRLRVKKNQKQKAVKVKKEKTKQPKAKKVKVKKVKTVKGKKAEETATYPPVFKAMSACPCCGKLVSADNAYCSNCGTAVK